MFMDGNVQYDKDVSSSQLNYRFNAIPIKFPETFFFISSVLKKLWKYKELRIANTHERKSKVGVLPLSDFQT